MRAPATRRSFPIMIALVLLLTLLSGCGGNQILQESDADPPGQPTSATALAGTATKSDAGAKKQVIKLVDAQWQSLEINNAIAKFILENGYGYPVQIVQMSEADMQLALVTGEVDVMMELWKSNYLSWYEDVTKSGKILDLGDTFESAVQAWYVPRYVVEGDAKRGIAPMAPDLKSVADLSKYKDLFKDPEHPEKGLLLDCIEGWSCQKINAIKLHAYGLDASYDLQNPVSEDTLDSNITAAYKAGKPLLFFYWEPSWVVGAYDLVRLDEPAYSKACNDQIQAAVNNSIKIEDVTSAAGCAYENVGITKGIYPGLKQRAPEVTTFLQKMNVGTQPLNKGTAYMQNNQVDADKAALWFFENYPDTWRKWLPDDVRTKVEEALRKAGVKL